MFYPSWEKIAKVSHYCRSGLVVSTVSCGLIILFICFGLPVELAFNEIILTFFATAALIAHLFSNATYIAGTIDHFQNADPTTKIERWATLIGILIGFTAGIALSLTLPSLTFFTFLSTTTVTTGAIAGLCNRFGGIERRPDLEQACLKVSAIVGATMGASIIFMGIPFIHITGVISFITAGPPIMASAIFLCLVTSLFMSGADYFSKAILYLPKLFKKGRHHEYEGSFCGALISIAAIIFFITHLHLLVGVKLTLTGFNVIATTITLFAKCFGIDGICSRLGRTFDELFEQEDTIYEKAAKGMLVITGIAGLMVVVDICSKIKNYIYCKKTPDPSSANTPLVHGSSTFIIEKTKLDLTEEANKNSIQILPSPLSVVAPSSPRPSSPLNSLSPLSPSPSYSREPSPPPSSSADLSPESTTRSPSTSWWKKFSLNLWTTIFYTPTPRDMYANSFDKKRSTQQISTLQS